MSLLRYHIFCRIADHLRFFRLRILRDEPHSQLLAERAIGLGFVDNGKREENLDEMKE